jgi:hypothetical protein
MESRLARLEGAYEQIANRLTDLRQDVESGFVGLRQDILALRQDMGQRFNAVDQRYTWVVGMIVGTWITTILTSSSIAEHLVRRDGARDRADE